VPGTSRIDHADPRKRERGIELFRLAGSYRERLQPRQEPTLGLSASVADEVQPRQPYVVPVPERPWRDVPGFERFDEVLLVH
jgi:hypothetical protein